MEAPALEPRRLKQGKHIQHLPCACEVSRGESGRLAAQRVFYSRRIRTGEIQCLCTLLSAASEYGQVPIAKWEAHSMEQWVILTTAFMPLSNQLIIVLMRSAYMTYPQMLTLRECLSAISTFHRWYCGCFL